MEISTQGLLAIIGEKTVEVYLLKSQIADLLSKMEQTEQPPALPSSVPYKAPRIDGEPSNSETGTSTHVPPRNA